MTDRYQHAASMLALSTATRVLESLTSALTYHRKNEVLHTFILVEFGVKIIESCNDEVIDEANLITQFLHLNG